MDWLRRRYTHPVVVVESSDRAEEVCLRNGLRVHQLLRPFANYDGPLYAKVGDRGQAVNSNNFGVRLVRGMCVRPVEPALREIFLQRMVEESSPIDLAYGEQLDHVLRELLQPENKSISSSSNITSSNSKIEDSYHTTVRANAGCTDNAPQPRPVRLNSQSSLELLMQRVHPYWHGAFVRDFVKLIRCSYFDTVDYPVGVIYVISSSEVDMSLSSNNNSNNGLEQVQRAFQRLAIRMSEFTQDMPSMESNELHRYYLILHSVTHGPSIDQARQLLSYTQRLFGTPNCALLKINSVLHPEEHVARALDPRLWVDANEMTLDVPAGSINSTDNSSLSSLSTSVMDSGNNKSNPTSKSSLLSRLPLQIQNTFGNHHSHSSSVSAAATMKVTGCHLNPEDVIEITNVMSYYLRQSLYKHLEKRLRALDIVVQDRRTTTLSKVASWFTRSKNDESKNSTLDVVLRRSDHAAIYVSSSLEMQMRHCGDLSMALQDYQGAMEYYKMCIDELLETLSQRSYNRVLIAGCQEGIAIANVLAGRFTLPSMAPWSSPLTRSDFRGKNSSSSSSSSSPSRFEMAMSDYLACGEKLYALRVALMVYELCKNCNPPAVDRALIMLQSILRLRLVNEAHLTLVKSFVYDGLASCALFPNLPKPIVYTSPTSSNAHHINFAEIHNNNNNMSCSSSITSGTAGSSMLVENYPIDAYTRTYAINLIRAGKVYREAHVHSMALRCYLRALEVFRGIGRRGFWLAIFEEILTSLAQLYFTLGHAIEGIVMATAAVALGTPAYSSTTTGEQNFKYFWAQQQKVLKAIGYALCPHMPLPCVDRHSFTISRNYYGVDSITELTIKQTGQQVCESEWRLMEDHLRRYYNRTVMHFLTNAFSPSSSSSTTTTGAHHHRFPRFRAGNRSERLFGSPVKGQNLMENNNISSNYMKSSESNVGIVHGSLVNNNSSNTEKNIQGLAIEPLDKTNINKQGIGQDSKTTSDTKMNTTTTMMTTTNTMTNNSNDTTKSAINVTQNSYNSNWNMYNGNDRQATFTMARGEPLTLSFTMQNPLGTTLQVHKLCLLYIALASPHQLWKSSLSRSLSIAPNSESRNILLTFDPPQEGHYVILGLCWVLAEQEGYYYFATREAKDGCVESLYSYAMEHPTPNINSPENVHVEVLAPRASLQASFIPPLPHMLCHGEYYHTSLVITNQNTLCPAGHIYVQRSANNAHLMWLPAFDLESNLQTEKPLKIAEELQPGETIRMDVVIRAQHDRGDVTQHCTNHFFLLFVYTSGIEIHHHHKRSKEVLQEEQQHQQQKSSNTSGGVATATNINSKEHTSEEVIPTHDNPFEHEKTADTYDSNISYNAKKDISNNNTVMNHTISTETQGLTSYGKANSSSLSSSELMTNTTSSTPLYTTHHELHEKNSTQVNNLNTQKDTNTETLQLPTPSSLLTEKEESEEENVYQHGKTDTFASNAAMSTSSSLTDSTLTTNTTELMTESHYVPSVSSHRTYTSSAMMNNTTINTNMDKYKDENGCIRLHRMLRSVEVRPMMALYSTLLAPTGSSLATAVLMTAKHIAPLNEPPVRVARICALHDPHWRVTAPFTSTLTRDRAMSCVVFPGGAVTLPLLLERQAGLIEDDNFAKYLPSPTTTNTTSDHENNTITTESSKKHVEDKNNTSYDNDNEFRSTECLSLSETIPNPAKREHVIQNVSFDANGVSAMTEYFMQTSLRGAGEVGQVEHYNNVMGSFTSLLCGNVNGIHDSNDGSFNLNDNNMIDGHESGSGGGYYNNHMRHDTGLTFYLDKAAQAKRKAEEEEEELEEEQEKVEEDKHKKGSAGGKNSKKSRAKRDPFRKRNELERKLYGAVREQFTPLVVAVTWVLDEPYSHSLSSPSLLHEERTVQNVEQSTSTHAIPDNTTISISDGNTHEENNKSTTELSKNIRSGVLYHFFDPMHFVHRTSHYDYVPLICKETDKKVNAANNESFDILNSNYNSPMVSSAMDAWSEETFRSVKQRQYKLCALLLLKQSVHVNYWAVAYHVSVPLHVENTLSHPSYALVPITVTCLSLSPLPLLIHLHGESSFSNTSSILFDTSTHNNDCEDGFVLMPSSRYTIHFTAQLHRAGLANCNAFHFDVRPLKFITQSTSTPLHDKEMEKDSSKEEHKTTSHSAMFTGMTQTALIDMLRHKVLHNELPICTTTPSESISTPSVVAVQPPTSSSTPSTSLPLTRSFASSTPLSQLNRRTLENKNKINNNDRDGIASNSFALSENNNKNNKDIKGTNNKANKEEVEDLLRRVTPPNMLGTTIVILGEHIPALTQVCFRYTERSVNVNQHEQHEIANNALPSVVDRSESRVEGDDVKVKENMESNVYVNDSNKIESKEKEQDAFDQQTSVTSTPNVETQVPVKFTSSQEETSPLNEENTEALPPKVVIPDKQQQQQKHTNIHLPLSSEAQDLFATPPNAHFDINNYLPASTEPTNATTKTMTPIYNNNNNYTSQINHHILDSIFSSSSTNSTNRNNYHDNDGDDDDDTASQVLTSATTSSHNINDNHEIKEDSSDRSYSASEQTNSKH